METNPTPALCLTMLQQAMVRQLIRYNALPALKRNRRYGRRLYADIRELNETILTLNS